MLDEKVKKWNQQAIQAIVNFFHKLNIVTDKQLINDQQNIPIYIGQAKTERITCATGEYDAQEDIITLSEEELTSPDFSDYDNPNV